MGDPEQYLQGVPGCEGSSRYLIQQQTDIAFYAMHIAKERVQILP